MMKIVSECKSCSGRIPLTRDPFVNTRLINVGKDGSGIERFWISTWNQTQGTTGVLIDENGNYRKYSFSSEHPGFYSAVSEDSNTLWLCGGLDTVVRLDLKTGEYDAFPTGAPCALVFQGMILDIETRKLFALAFPAPTVTAFSFDIDTRKTVKIHKAFSDGHYMRFSFPNGDGTYSIIVTTPGQYILHWDPVSETLNSKTLDDLHGRPGGGITSLIGDVSGRYYFPGRGWYNGVQQKFEDGPRPEQEMTWFVRHDEKAFGTTKDDTGTRIGVWDLITGSVRSVCTVPEMTVFGANVTSTGRIVAISMYGDFFRFHSETGALEQSKRLATDAIGRVDCLCRIDEERLLGTPYITQRFWELNLKTGEGFDCGKSGPGGGEILRTWKIGSKIYMAAYAGGELMEYDPSRPPRYPENPRVVAKPHHGMRPVSNADDGRVIFYTCSAPYGKLGSVLVRYDTETGLASYAEHPLPDLQIIDLLHDPHTNRLLAGTSINADSGSCPPGTDTAWLALIHADDLSVIEKMPAPQGTAQVKIWGWLNERQCLCSFWGEKKTKAVVDMDDFRLLAENELTSWPDGLEDIKYAGSPGMFVMQIENRLELWDLREDKRIKVLVEDWDGHKYHIMDGAVYLDTGTEIVVMEGAL